MMVKFATTCDRCGARSPEYDVWPSCAECGEDLCPRCSKIEDEICCGECPVKHQICERCQGEYDSELALWALERALAEESENARLLSAEESDV